MIPAQVDCGPFEIAPGLILQSMNPMSDCEVAEVGRMYLAYLREELDRVGHLAAGFPIAPYLATVLIFHEMRLAGFVAVHPMQRSVELIYVEPSDRGQGISTNVLKFLEGVCPEPLALSAPLSSGGQALADSLNLRVTYWKPEVAAAEERGLVNLHAEIKRYCKHKKRSGDPGKPCHRCYRAGLRRYAEQLIYTQTMAVRAATLTSGRTA